MNDKKIALSKKLTANKEDALRAILRLSEVYVHVEKLKCGFPDGYIEYMFGHSVDELRLYFEGLEDE